MSISDSVELCVRILRLIVERIKAKHKLTFFTKKLMLISQMQPVNSWSVYFFEICTTNDFLAIILELKNYDKLKISTNALNVAITADVAVQGYP